MGNEFESDQRDIRQLLDRLRTNGVDFDRTLIALRTRLNAHEVAAQAQLYPELIRSRPEVVEMVHTREQEFRDIDVSLGNVELTHGASFDEELSQLIDVVDRQFDWEAEMVSMLSQQVSSQRFEEVEERFDSCRDAELKSFESSRQTESEPPS